jgi:hypothetical protein
MPPAVFLTWLQLRALTWCGPDVPHFSFGDWADLTGTSRASLTRHLDWLQHHRFLRWDSPGPGLVGVHFNPQVQPNLPGLKQRPWKDKNSLATPLKKDGSPQDFSGMKF